MADWFNNDLSEYINKKEKVIIDVRKNDKICVISSFISSLFFSLFLAFFIGVFSGVISAFISNADPNFFVVITMGIIVFVCGYPLFLCLIYNSERSIRYVLTNKGIYAISGLIFKHTKFVAYNQITDVSMAKGPIQTFIGCGSVGVGTASGNVVGSVSDGNGSITSMNELDIIAVDNYKQIREIIIKNRKK